VKESQGNEAVNRPTATSDKGWSIGEKDTKREN
jgi:hypothetical protein